MEAAETTVGDAGHPRGDNLMDCLVSAVAARVVFIEGNDVKYIEADQPAIETRTTLAEVPMLLADAYDVVLLKNTSTPAALECLLGLWNRDRALRMLDIVLDDTSDESEVLEASGYLAAFLSNASVRAWLLDRTFATPYDSDVDFGALAGTLKPFPATLEFVSHLNAFQDRIRQVRIAWDRVPDSTFESAKSRSVFEFHAVSRGAFRRLAEAVGDPAAVKNAVFTCYHELRTQANYRAVIGEWTKPFLERSLKPTINVRDREEEEEPEPFTEEFGPIHQTYTNVRTEQRGIIQQLEKGNVSQARRFAEQLVKRQLQTGGAEYAAMSLCLLAQEA
jgi:hypothetical protein